MQQIRRFVETHLRSSDPALRTIGRLMIVGLCSLSLGLTGLIFFSVVP